MAAEQRGRGMNDKIVPFGKYKGQPIEALQHDPAYCEWLAGQDWFRARFTAIHTLIVNNFGQPSDTPEHNQLQARFLDDEWLCRFLTARVGRPAVKAALEYRLNAVYNDRQTCRTKLQDVLTSYQQRDWTYGVKDTIERSIREAQKMQALARVHAGIDAWTKDVARLQVFRDAAPEWNDIDTEFEQKGVDVIVTASVRFAGQAEEIESGQVCEWAGESAYSLSTSGWLRLAKDYRFAVELKPTLGDDYPAVLRQMRASDCDTLVIEEYTGSGATLTQVRAIFLPIPVMTVPGIEQTEPL
jgi:hypothetical protein